jgi:hypothetical protein
LAGARDALRRGHELGGRTAKWDGTLSARWLGECGRLIELDRRLPAFLRGEDRAADAQELVDFGSLCLARDYPGAAARCYAEAFAARPKLADDLDGGHRYAAASAAALAGCGLGRDSPPLDEPARGRWRQQALAWLRADLALFCQHLSGGKGDVQAAVRRVLLYRRHDPSLSGLRDAAALVKLPEEEREACHKLWAEVDALLARLCVSS